MNFLQFPNLKKKNSCPNPTSKKENFVEKDLGKFMIYNFGSKMIIFNPETSIYGIHILEKKPYSSDYLFIHRYPKVPINHCGYHPKMILVALQTAQVTLNARCTKTPTTIVWALR